jgi:membrane carboxypeptidase/penicillin-binding protein
MTGGHGAVPYFNAFMIPFMKDKPKETFPDAPPVPAEIKTKIERNKREEQEKLERADEAGRTTGVIFNTGTKKSATPTDTAVTSDSPDIIVPGDKPAGNDDAAKPTTVPKSNDDQPKPKPVNPPNPVKKTENPPTDNKPQGEKRKGKKGGGDN